MIVYTQLSSAASPGSRAFDSTVCVMCIIILSLLMAVLVLQALSKSEIESLRKCDLHVRAAMACPHRSRF